MRLLYSFLFVLVSLSAMAQRSAGTKASVSKSTAAKPVAPAEPAAAPVAAPTPGTVEMLDAHYGFRDAKLEADSSKVHGLIFERRDNDLFYYHRYTDSLLFAGATLGSVNYLFYRGKLLSISITTKGAANSHAVLEKLQALYGAGTQKPQKPQYTWRGEKVLLKYDESTTSNNAVVNIISLPLTNKRQLDAAEAAQKTASNQ